MTEQRSESMFPTNAHFVRALLIASSRIFFLERVQNAIVLLSPDTNDVLAFLCILESNHCGVFIEDVLCDLDK